MSPFYFVLITQCVLLLWLKKANRFISVQFVILSICRVPIMWNMKIVAAKVDSKWLAETWSKID